jgi:hypothetical protein
VLYQKISYSTVEDYWNRNSIKKLNIEIDTENQAKELESQKT